MALFDKKTEPTLLEFRAHLQEQCDIVEGNRQRMNIANKSAEGNRYAHTAKWLQAVVQEIDDFLRARTVL